MSKKLSILMLLMALIVPWAANAQQTVTIGDGTSKQYTLPVNMYFNYSLTQQIYTADEIGTAGTISSIAFDYTYSASFSMAGVQVYMMNVDKELFTDENDIIALTTATKVFEGTFSASGAGWVTITLDTPFQYDGESNLLLCCYDPTNGNAGGDSSSNWKFNTTRSTLEYPSISWYSDDYIPNLTNLTSYSGTKTKYKYRNNIRLVITPETCTKPSTLVADGNTITWTEGSGTYNVEYKKSSETNWTRAYTNLAATTCTLTLDPNTDYDVRVQSVCSGNDTSAWKIISFTTPCSAVTIDATHSWSEGFESYNVGTSTTSGAEVTDIPCWERVQINSTTHSPFVYRNYSVAASTGSASLELKTSSGNPVMVALPEFTEAIENLNVAFNYNCTSTAYTYTVELGYISDVTDASTFVKLFDIPRPVIRSSGHSSYSKDLYEAAAAANAPAGSRVAIKFATTSTYTPSWNFDDFVVSYVSPCRKPTGLTVVANSITARTATITWDAEAGVTFQWHINGTWNTTQNNTVELTGLTPDHDYTFTLRKKCSNTEFSNEITVNFSTTIACPAPTNLTLSNITGHTVTASWTGSNDSYIVKYRTAAYMNGVDEHFDTSSIPEGWTRYSGLVNNVIAGSATLTETDYGWYSSSYGLGSYNMKVNIWGSSCNYWLVTPEFTIGQGFNLNFDLALTDYNNSDPIEDPTAQADDRFVVLVFANDAWHILREWNNSGSNYVYNTIATTGENVSIDLSSYQGRTVKIAFYGQSTAAGGDNDLHIDNVSVGIPVPAGQWQTITVDEPTVTITGLAPETLYEVVVQSDCGNEGLSAEVGPVPFTTGVACTPPTNLHTTDVTAHEAVLHWDGYAESYNVSYYKTFFFDDFEEDLSQWTIYKEGDDASWEWAIENPHDNSTDLNAHSGYYSAVAYSDFEVHADSWLVTPQIQFPNETTLKFWIMRSTYDDAKDEYEVRLSTTGNAISDFTTVLKEKAAANSRWTEVSIDLSEYDGQQGYIAIRHDFTDGFFLMVDDFGIFGWSEDIVTTADSLLIEDLLPETEYKWRVQANCGDEDGISQWSSINYFTTLRTCPVPIGLNASNETAHGATLDWTGLSDSYNVWIGELESASSIYDFENGIHTDFTNSTTYPWTVTTNDKHGGTYSAKSGGTGINYATSDLTLSVTLVSDATVSFWAKVSSESGWDYGRFLIDGTQKFQVSGTTNNWTQYSYDLTAGTHTLIWRFYKDVSDYSEVGDDCFYVDDIIIGTDAVTSEMSYIVTEVPFVLDDAQHIQPETSYMVKVKGICDDEETDYCEPIIFTTTVTCLPIDSLSYTNLTTTSVNLNWVLVDGTQTAWQICLNGDENNLIAADTHENFLLGDLQPETEYTVKVRAFCEENDQSRWSPILTFTTPVSCYAVNALSYDNLAATSVNLSWVLEDETQTAWQICLNGNENNLIAADTNEDFLLGGLTPNTEYTVKVRANCGVNDYGRWSNTITFTTPEICPTPTDFTASNITAVSADLSWNGSLDVESYTVRYRSTAGVVAHYIEDFSDNIDYWSTPNCVSGTGITNGTFAFFRSTDADNHNQYLISPELTSYITNNSVLEFQYHAFNASYAETFQVGFSSTTKDISSFSWGETITANTTANQTYHANVPAGTKYIAIQCTSYRKYYLFIDDIVIGHEAADGQWMTETTAETEVQLINLNGGTRYEAQVRSNCNPDGWCSLITINTELDGTKVFVNEGDWNTASNWIPQGTPALSDKVILRADATIPNGCVAEANRIFFEGTTLTIESGGQLKVNSDITATIKKAITGYGANNEETSNGFYLIATPTTTAVTAANAGLITAQSNYDLYNWNRTATDEEWHNSHNGISMANGTGYLYANQGDVEMNITATMQRSSLPVTMTADYNDQLGGGWSLCGNPFPCEVYLSTNAEGMAFYRLVGNTFVPITGAVAPMEGFFVKATAAGQTFTISREAPAK